MLKQSCFLTGFCPYLLKQARILAGGLVVWLWLMLALPATASAAALEVTLGGQNSWSWLNSLLEVCVAGGACTNFTGTGTTQTVTLSPGEQVELYFTGGEGRNYIWFEVDLEGKRILQATKAGMDNWQARDKIFSFTVPASTNDFVTLHTWFKGVDYPTYQFYTPGVVLTLQQRSVYLPTSASNRGWAVMPDGVMAYADGKNLSSAESTTLEVDLYNVWNNGITVYFECNGGGGNTPSFDFHNGDPGVSLPTNGCAWKNHHFLGWGETPAGTVVYQDGQGIGHLKTDDTNIRLYAQWQADPSVKLQPRGGLGDMDELYYVLKPQGTPTFVTTPLATFKRPNFNFLGWTSDPQSSLGSGPNFYAAGASFEVTNFPAGTTLYALWDYQMPAGYAGTWADPAHFDPSWNEASDGRYAGCTTAVGSQTCPWLIQTEAELASLAWVNNVYYGQWFKLARTGAGGANTFDLSAREWIPINLYGNFRGRDLAAANLIHLLGNGATITGLQVSRLVPAVLLPLNGKCEEQADDAACFAAAATGNPAFATGGAAGFFGETYKVQLTDLTLSVPKVQLSAPSLIRGLPLTAKEQADEPACLNELQAHHGRCQDYGCAVVGLKEKIIALGLVLVACPSQATGGEICYAATGPNATSSSALVSSDKVELKYRPGMGTVVEVASECELLGQCEYHYTYANGEKLTVKCKGLDGCTFTYAGAGTNFACEKIAYDSYDNVGSLIGAARGTYLAQVKVEQPQLQVSGLTPGYHVGGLVGATTGWSYLNRVRVTGSGPLEVMEGKTDAPLAQIRSRFIGGLVGLNYKSTITDGFTDVPVHYRLADEVYAYLAKYTMSNDEAEAVVPRVSVGGLAGGNNTSIFTEYHDGNAYRFPTRILNSYSWSELKLKGNYLPHWQASEPLADGQWSDHLGDRGDKNGYVRFSFGGIAGLVEGELTNNYYAGSISVTPDATPAALLTQLNDGTDFVKTVMTQHSLGQQQPWTQAQIDYFKAQVKSWMIDPGQNSGYPIFYAAKASGCSGGKVDVGGGVCACPSGEHEAGGICCPQNYHGENGVCVADRCAPGEQKNSLGVCVVCASDHVLDAADACVCPDGSSEDRLGQCQAPLPVPVLEHQVRAADLCWNILNLSPTMTSVTLRGYFEPTSVKRKLELALTLPTLPGGSYGQRLRVQTSTTAKTNFAFTMPITALQASASSAIIPGPQLLVISETDSGFTTALDWNVNFYFPIKDPKQRANWGGAFILSTNSQLN